MLKHYLNREEAITELACLNGLKECKHFPSPLWPKLRPTVGNARLLKQIVQRDLKPEHIIVKKSDHTLKSTDFGLAEFVGRSRTHSASEYVGTLPYIAPEVKKHVNT